MLYLLDLGFKIIKLLEYIPYVPLIICASLDVSLVALVAKLHKQIDGAHLLWEEEDKIMVICFEWLE